MASTQSIFSILAAFTLIFILIDPSFARNHNKLSLKKLCSKTEDRQLCMRLMSSNYQSLDGDYLDADYRSLTEVAIDLAYSKAEEIRQDIKYLIQDTRNHDKKEVYNSCSKNYHDVLKDLQKTKNLFRDGDYKQIEVQIKDAIEEVHECKDQVKRRENDLSNLKTKNREFEILCNIVRVSAKYWKGDDWENKKN